MKPRISVLTLGVDDNNAVEFYRGLGLKTEGILGKEFEHGRGIFRFKRGPETGAMAA